MNCHYCGRETEQRASVTLDRLTGRSEVWYICEKCAGPCIECGRLVLDTRLIRRCCPKIRKIAAAVFGRQR